MKKVVVVISTILSISLLSCNKHKEVKPTTYNQKIYAVDTEGYLMTKTNEDFGKQKEIEITNTITSIKYLMVSTDLNLYVYENDSASIVVDYKLLNYKRYLRNKLVLDIKMTKLN